MSKELEVLHKLFVPEDYNVAILDHDLDVSVEDEIYRVLLKALTPPTEEEVCKALSEWLKENKPELWVKKVQHDTGGFHYYNNEDYEVYLVEYDDIDKTMFFTQWLPFDLIEMVVKFYKGESK